MACILTYLKSEESLTTPPHHNSRPGALASMEATGAAKQGDQAQNAVGNFVSQFGELRLVSAVLAEQDEEWMTAKIYLNMKP